MSRSGEAVESTDAALSDARVGFYFGLIGPESEGWFQYGWLPNGVPLYDG